MKKLIKFEPWIDPLNSNIDEIEWPGFDLDEDDSQVPVLEGQKQIKVIQTPMGFVSALESSFASYNFHFWIMHTNFDLNNENVEVIKTTDGVETFEPYTRYRARLGFPKSGFFKPRNIMSEIQKRITNFYKEEQLKTIEEFPIETQEKINDAIKTINDKYNSWTMLILPNGNIELVTSNVDDDSYKEKTEKLYDVCENVGGKIIQSE